ncbi:MAG: MFS transporter [Patescibacteria group bacterium]
MEIRENNNLYAGNTETDHNIKIRWKAGLMALFVVSGVQLIIGNPFIYSLDYQFSIISVAVLAFGAAVAIVLSLHSIEKMLAEKRFKTWKVATTSLIFAALFMFFYFISTFFYLQTIGSTEGLEAIVSIFFAVILLPFSSFIIFVSGILFSKLYEKRAARNIFLILFLSSIIFSFSVIGIRIADYNNCNFGKDEECVTGKATATNDASLCDINRYANPQNRNECRIKVSEKATDTSICREIEDGAGRNPESFKYQCFANIAINTKNYSLCNDLKETSYRNECYSVIANRINDLNTCDKVSNEPSQFSDCVENIAINTNNRDLCEKVDGENKKSCYLGFDLNLSKISKDTAICDKIKSSGWGSVQIGFCLTNVAEYTGNYSLCENIKEYSNYRDVCYVAVSRKSTNINICKIIKKPEEISDCIANIAINTGNRSLCDDVKNEYYKEYCYIDFDKNRRN